MVKNNTFLLAPNLLQINDDSPGWTRVRRGENYVFVDENGREIKKKKHLQRLQALVIPPAYQEVWICPRSKGYLQVTARDHKGRKQYIYHPDWIAYQQNRKFQKFAEFALELPGDLAPQRTHRLFRRCAGVFLLHDDDPCQVGNDHVG